MRALSSASVVTAAAATSLLLAPAAYATPPGDNGTVKIHDAATDEELHKNEPHVCTFYLDAFGFDSEQQVTWRIIEMPPTGSKDTVATSGSLTLDLEGLGRSEDLSLPDGHYKLVWNFDGENGRAKHKVFWTECESDEPGDEPSAPAEEPTEGAEPGGSEPQGGGDSDLAATGSGAPTGALAAGAASLLGVGAYLVLRRRTARSRQD